MISACRLHFLIRRKVVGGSSEVRPRDVCLISGSGYSKDKQFKGAKVALSASNSPHTRFDFITKGAQPNESRAKCE